VTRFVLDASFAMTWIMEVERTPATLKYFDALTRGELTAIVPAIWPEEISNVLLSVERSRKLTAAQAAIWIDVLKDLPIEVDQALIEESFGEVRLLAQAHGLTAYDARYLHLAIKQGVKLATRDKQLLAAAPKVGVKLVD
jgi:predicted nucleic acid-binding protein